METERLSPIRGQSGISALSTFGWKFAPASTRHLFLDPQERSLILPPSMILLRLAGRTLNGLATSIRSSESRHTRQPIVGGNACVAGWRVIRQRSRAMVL